MKTEIYLKIFSSINQMKVNAQTSSLPVEFYVGLTPVGSDTCSVLRLGIDELHLRGPVISYPKVPIHIKNAVFCITELPARIEHPNPILVRQVTEQSENIYIRCIIILQLIKGDNLDMI